MRDFAKRTLRTLKIANRSTPSVKSVTQLLLQVLTVRQVAVLLHVVDQCVEFFFGVAACQSKLQCDSTNVTETVFANVYAYIPVCVRSVCVCVCVCVCSTIHRCSMYKYASNEHEHLCRKE